MDQFTMAEFAKNSENKEGAEFTPSVQEDGISQGTLIVSKLYNTMLGEITKYLRSINAELVNVLDEAGISPSALSDEQLYTAIKKIIEQSHGRNVGDVYFSYSSSAADNVGGLPLFTGELISNADNLYPQFYAWLGDHPEVCTTEASWQSAIGTYGECPKYVLNTNDRTIRLPILKNYLKMANTTDGITQGAAGLPNISGIIGDVVTYGTNSSGAFIFIEGQGKQTTSNGNPWHYTSVGFNATLSDSTYGNSNTVTPAHTTLYPWVCVYNEAIPASTAQAAEFQAALSGKSDIDLGNITTAGNKVISKMSTPSTTYDTLTLGASHDTYQAPADGYFVLCKTVASGQLINIECNETHITGTAEASVLSNPSVSVPCQKGQTVTIDYTGTGAVIRFIFVYLEGNK